MNFKKGVKWVGLLSIIGIVLLLANEFFIRDWRIQHSEKSVQKSIIKNYEGKEEKFSDLINYVRKLNMPPIVEIEFLKNNKINSYLNSPFVSDSIKL